MWLNANSVMRETAVEGFGTWGLCVGAAVDLTEDEVARTMPYRGDWICCSTLGRLRPRFDVVMEGARPHAVLLLKAVPSGVDWEGWEDLRDRFDDPRPNPGSAGVLP